MNYRKGLCFVLAAAICLSFAACGSKEGAVYVQSVAELADMGGIAPGDRFAGLVVSENVAQIEKDAERTIAELLVKEGDDVEEGAALFSYDTEELQLMLDKQLLELEQLKASIESYKEQIQQLEKDSKRVSASDKLQYTIQIQSTQLDLTEAEMNLKTQEAEVDRSEDILENATVTSPVTGRVQSVIENGTDNYGNPLPYITIQQSGSYRIKGMLGELQRGSITEGTRIRIVSRTHEDQNWVGTVSLVDYENPSQGAGNNYYGMAVDEMTVASRYPFYVELDSTEGLLLGQHVYMELYTEDGQQPGLSVGSVFICYEEDGSTYVWAENRNKLEKRSVTLGEYNSMMDTFQITEGLAETDYIAFPDAELCKEGVPTTHEMVAADDQAQEGGDA